MSGTISRTHGATRYAVSLSEGLRRPTELPSRLLYGALPLLMVSRDRVPLWRARSAQWGRQ